MCNSFERAGRCIAHSWSVINIGTQIPLMMTPFILSFANLLLLPSGNKNFNLLKCLADV